MAVVKKEDLGGFGYVQYLQRAVRDGTNLCSVCERHVRVPRDLPAVVWHLDVDVFLFFHAECAASFAVKLVRDVHTTQVVCARNEF